MYAKWKPAIEIILKGGELNDLKVPRNPSNLAFICTQIGLIHDIFSFFVCKKHY